MGAYTEYKLRAAEARASLDRARSFERPGLTRIADLWETLAEETVSPAAARERLLTAAQASQRASACRTVARLAIPGQESQLMKIAEAWDALARERAGQNPRR